MTVPRKRIVVTGPTSGLGKQIALDLAREGADLILACRDTVKGAALADEISRNGSGTSAAVVPVDVSSQRSIRDFASELRRRFQRLDVLVNNAGTVQLDRHESVDGLELTFATNVLGYHLLTQELLPLLSASAPSRIVIVASTFAGDLDLDDLQFQRRPFEGLRAYAQSKACNRLLTWALSRRLSNTGTVANAMAPGFVPGTDLSRNLAPETRRAYQERSGRSIAEGADTAVWLATSPAAASTTGLFYFDRQELHCQFRNAEVEERLWSICERLIST